MTTLGNDKSGNICAPYTERPKAILFIIVIFVSTTVVYMWTSRNGFSVEQFAMTNFKQPLKTSVKRPFPKRISYNHTLENKTHSILIFNIPEWVSWTSTNDVFHRCQHSNCQLGRDRSDLSGYSAVIFYLTAAPALPVKPPTRAFPDQVWLFAWLESPVHHSGIRRIYMNDHWKNTVNWTMTYTHDADVPYPYGRIRARAPPVRNYTELFYKKTKMAAWVVSNCHTQSQRERYVEKLRENGIKVDVFGGCSGKRVDKEIIKKEINSKYKFYLAFENSLCKDYITEKFFGYFDYDVLLVVRGGGNYKSILSNNTYINTADFTHVKDLAQFMLEVASNEEMYTSFMKNKDRFESVKDVRNETFCTLCQKLNALDSNRKTYSDLVKRVHEGTCHPPTDIP